MSKSNPVISVIIPTYNRVERLSRAIRSVVNQTFPAGECIVVDDGSGDTTREVVEGIKGQSAVPLVYYYQDNAGASAARNRGIAVSRYPFIAFLDSDDWWLPQKLEQQYQAMCDSPAYLISHTREIWYRHGKRVNQKKKHDPPQGDIFSPSLRMCMVGMSTVMVRRECFERFGMFDERFPCCEDYDLWLRMSCRIPFLRVREALTCKDGGREDQLSAIYRQGMDVYRIRSLCKLLDSSRLTPEHYRLAAEELTRKCRIYGEGCVKHGRPEEGRQYLELSKRYMKIVIGDQRG